MKRLIIITLFALTSTGCYVPMPSVGVKPTQVRHQEVCTYVPGTDRLQCKRTRTWTR